MTLGEKLKKARADRGLSQSQVSGNFITRNMLSQLEHDQASPSLKTLEYLASVLDVPISWLVGDDACIHQQEDLKAARQLYTDKKYHDCALFLLNLPELTQEERLLLFKSTLATAHILFQSGDPSDALQMVKHCIDAAANCIYCGVWENAEASYLQIQCQAALHHTVVQECQSFLSDYQTLHLAEQQHLASARLAISIGDLQLADRELCLCMPNSDETLCQYNMLKGELLIMQQQFSTALQFLKEAEGSIHASASFRMELCRLMELCYKETEDYKMAYHYAVLRLQGQ